MSSTPSFNAEQLAAVRSAHWHQGGDALLTIEAAREWVNEAGLVLFAPRGHQLAIPAPSLVEATLGRAVSAPTIAESETARGLVARMVADGTVVPLNLLGGPGDVPDFVVSAQMFSYVFTLRGDKNWKQPPSTSGTGKVSPLALKVYEVLAQGNALTAGELVGELGRELTENAIARALGELWAQMRVIPLLQQDGAATMWELTARRFTKQIKTGANAGQPTALSALISVYLAQAFVASEEEIEIFLSPLSARSRTRDVLHGLTAARQLENVVLEGKTLLYIPGALPEFPEVAEPVAAEGDTDAAASAAAGVIAAAAMGERIRRYDRPRGPREERFQRPRREGEGRGERPIRREGGEREERRRPAKPFGERRPERSGERRSFGERERRPFQRDRAEGGRTERERRPFERDRAERGGDRERKSFTRPWDEERKPRPRREEGERREGARTFRKEGESAGREFRGKPEFRKGPKKEFGARPRRAEGEGGERGERPFRPRREGQGGERPFRPRREGQSGERPFRPRREGDAGERPFRPRREGQSGERPFRPRREGDAGERPFRPRREGDRARTEGGRERPFRRRDEGSREGGERRPYRSAAGGERARPSGERRAGGRPGGKPGFGGKGKFGAKRGPGGPGGAKGKFGDKPKRESRERNVRAKDMRGDKKGERGSERPRRETEE